MADNFDSNVARRKPNVVESLRPAHPWDISTHSSETEPESVFEPSAPDASASVANAASSVRADSVAIMEHSSLEHDRANHEPLNTRKNDLSDAINIHSNFCKLDNDVSDYLFTKLSPSAQSVYLRLYRQSFGWNRNWAAESLPKLTRACNLSLQTVRKAIRELELLGCIRKEFSDYHKATVYRIYLPFEIGLGKISTVNNTFTLIGGLNSTILPLHDHSKPSQESFDKNSRLLNSERDGNKEGRDRFLEVNRTDSGGQNISIQSLYFSGASIYNVLESGEHLPKNISKYIIDIHLSRAVASIDEFYDSIGFGVVSRALYRKSLLDYFELLDSGFSHDDIRYAVRWTFKNSRSRPESFSLIKHTMHLALDDLIRDLKDVSGEKELALEKKEKLRHSLDREKQSLQHAITSEELQVFQEVLSDLKENLNVHSYQAFIAPLRLVQVEGERVVISAPTDSLSWVIDHYLDHIRDTYREHTGRDIAVEII